MFGKAIDYRLLRLFAHAGHPEAEEQRQLELNIGVASAQSRFDNRLGVSGRAGTAPAHRGGHLMGTRYFQIGFGRCGTTAIAQFFQRNGIPAVHYRRGELARRIDANLQAGRFILSGYEQYRVFTDMQYLRPHVHIEAYKYYRQIMEQVPDSKFILNTRDRERWVSSLIRYYGDKSDWIETYRTFYGLNDLAEVVNHWRRNWDCHHAAVQQAIPPERLLVFDIETDSPLLLCRFAGLDDAAARHYRRANASLNKSGRFIAALLPLPVRRRIPRTVKNPVRRLFWAHDSNSTESPPPPPDVTGVKTSHWTNAGPARGRR